jgi:hypothetical protein
MNVIRRIEQNNTRKRTELEVIPRNKCGIQKIFGLNAPEKKIKLIRDKK